MLHICLTLHHWYK